MKKLFITSILIFLSFISILFFSWNSYGQQNDDYSAKIDSLIQTTSPRSFNGVILITQKGKTKYSKAFGYSDFGNKIPLTINDNFMILSNSKPVTAVLILKEVEKGKIDLQSPVRKYLPDLPQSWADTVTIHHLLNMSSGITEINKPLSFKPGTGYLYHNANYTMLGHIFEKVTGESFINAANSLFNDLKMNNSYCLEEDKIQSKIINGYINTNNVFKLKERKILGGPWRDFIPAGGVVSTLKDLNIWNTKLHKGKVLKPETYKLMTNYSITGQTTVFGSEKIGYGYGIYNSNKTSVKYLGHGGKGQGFASVNIYFPKKDVSVIVLENQWSEDNVLHHYHEIKIREIVINSSLVK
jgi:D-alanyl-D-alanine carboxypeptidase